MKLFERRKPETVEELTERVRQKWCPSAELNQPAFHRHLTREIARAGRRGRLIETPVGTEDS